MSKKQKNPHVKPQITKRQIREAIYGYAFIGLWLTGVLVFFVYSVYSSLNYSFHEFVIDNGIKLNPLQNWYDNYVFIFDKVPNFTFSLQQFVSEMLLEVPMIVAFSLIISIMLNGKFHGRGMFRTIFFLPVVIATGPVMDTIVTSGVNIYSVAAFSNLLQEMPDFIFELFSDLFESLMSVLWLSGVQMQIFLAGLQKVPPMQYEAAKIDGASPWDSFWKITVPSIKPYVLLNLIYSIIFLSANDNPVIDQIVSAAENGSMGYSVSLAMSWLYSLVIIAMLLVVFLLFRERSDKHVRYEQTLDTIRTQKRAAAARKEG